MSEYSKLELRLKEDFMMAQAGDQVAYENFLTLASAVVKKSLAYFTGRVSSAETIEDLHQEVLIKIHEKRHTFRLDHPILPWIRAVTKYAFIDYYRQRKTLPSFVELHDGMSAPDQNLQEEFEELLETLTPQQRDLLDKVKIQGKSYQEISLETGASVSSLKTGFHRLMQNLKKRGPQ
jgi:RNA polymerase sigma-70 factor (ECF subfamily)